MPTYSKTRVDRAGRFLAEALRAAAASERRIGQENAELVEAIEIVDWWRGEHARPLSRVAANLRLYVAEEGEPIVAQRLKKFPTIAGKLLREPRMKLSRMADIGGIRAVLPDEDAVYRTGAKLRKNWTITRKFGGGPENVRAYFVELAKMVASLDQGRMPEREPLDRLTRLKEDIDTLEAERKR